MLQVLNGNNSWGSKLLRQELGGGKEVEDKRRGYESVKGERGVRLGAVRGLSLAVGG